MSVSFSKLGKFSFIIFSDQFSISSSFFSPSGTPNVGMFEVVLEALSLSYFFLDTFFFFLKKNLFIHF